MNHDGPGLYVHVPFCSTICPYCDFAVLTGDASKRARFVESLLGEIALVGDLGQPTCGLDGAIVASPAAPFDTLYFGGGTPTSLTPETLARIVESIRTTLPLATDVWIQIEANPEDVTRERIATWRALGVRTLSLGVQSFDRARLAFLGRRHRPEQARHAVELALQAGFETVSVDLIYGLPDDTATSWEAELERAVTIGPDHLSCYQLSMPESTPFGRAVARGSLSELAEEGRAELFVRTHELLSERGYAAYEVSNFAASPHHESRHNRKYWRHTPYLGLGPAAHSFAGDSRWWNARELADYRSRVARGERPVAGSERLSAVDLALEAVMLGLRTAAGIDLDELQARLGVDLLTLNSETLQTLEKEQLISISRSHVRATVRGLAVADSLAGALVLTPPTPPSTA